MENDNVMCPQCKTGHCVSEKDRKIGGYYQLCDSCLADFVDYHRSNEEELMSLTFLPIKGDFLNGYVQDHRDYLFRSS